MYIDPYTPIKLNLKYDNEETIINGVVMGTVQDGGESYLHVELNGSLLGNTHVKLNNPKPIIGIEQNYAPKPADYIILNKETDNGSFEMKLIDLRKIVSVETYSDHSREGSPQVTALHDIGGMMHVVIDPQLDKFKYIKLRLGIKDVED